MRPKKGFVKLTAVQKEKLRAALGNPALVSYAQVAEKAGVSKPKVIKESQTTGLRPKGNFIESRAVKQPKINARLAVRAKKIEDFVRFEALNKRAVSVNFLQSRFGGEKKFVSAVLARVEKALEAEGKAVIRRTKSDQPKRKSQVSSLSQGMHFR